MLYHYSDIEKNVRVAINANCHQQPLIDDPAQLRLSEIIRHCTERAAARAVLDAELHRLERGHTFGDSLRWQPGEKWGYVPLPPDFLRLVAFQMSDWRMPVTQAISPDCDEYLLQHIPYAGLRGNPQMPVCAVVNRQEGLALEFYSCQSDSATVVQAFYAPQPRIAADDTIDISEPLYAATVDICASMTKKIISNISNTVER